MDCKALLNSDKKRDWLDDLLLERITIPGQRYMENHRLVIMGDSGLFVSVYVRTLYGKRMEFNYDHSVLFARQDSMEEVYFDVGKTFHPIIDFSSCNANSQYSKERVVSGADVNDKYDHSFFDTLKYCKRPDDSTIQRCAEVLDYINGELQKASSINGIYESGMEGKRLQIAWIKSRARRTASYGLSVDHYRKDMENVVDMPATMMITGAGLDAPGCVCVFLDKKEQAIEWIARTREQYARFKEDEIEILKSVCSLERAIQTNTVDAYFQSNYEINKAFIEKHYPFRLPDKWNAVVR